jgi:hypothetical protein
MSTAVFAVARAAGLAADPVARSVAEDRAAAALVPFGNRVLPTRPLPASSINNTLVVAGA